MVIAVAGAGGKTSYIHEEARRYLSMGRRVLVTTTTHMYIEKDTLISDNADEIIKLLSEKSYCMAGRKGPDGKISPLSEKTYKRACRAADVVLVEADGSKHMPLKFPSENEPVIPDNTDRIVVIMGLHGIGMKCKDAVHRYELAERALGISKDTVIEQHHIDDIIRTGYTEPLRRKYPGAEIEVKKIKGL